MLQTIKAEDETYETEITLDHDEDVFFFSAVTQSVISETNPLHQLTPVEEVFFRAGGPGLYILSVSLVDGRTAVYNFYDEQLDTYTLVIDNDPWTEEQALKLPNIRRAVNMAHAAFGVTKLKLTYR